MMKRQLGVSMAELALILALVAIVAIPALMFLGNSVNDGLSNAGNSVQNADELFAVMSPTTNDPYAGGANIAVATTGVANDGGSTVSGDGTVPDFGSGFETGSMGSLTTSANGTEMAADALEYLADGGTLADGTSFADFFGSDWASYQDKLASMAAAGHQIAQAEYDSMSSPQNVGNNLNAIQDSYTQELASKYGDMYNMLASQYGADFATNGPAEVQALWASVNNSAGVISYGAQEFVALASDDASGLNSASYDESNNYKLAENLVGTQFQSGDMYYIPVVTEEAASSLQ